MTDQPIENYIEEFGEELGREYFAKGLTMWEAQKDEYVQLKAAKEGPIIP